jgi:hypothetical protein
VEWHANTGVGQRAMRVENGQIPGPWDSFVGMEMRTGDRGGESSSLRQGLGTWEAWCGGGSRKASSSPVAVAEIGVRTCWRCSSWCLFGGVLVEFDLEVTRRRGEEPRPVPAHR